MKTAPTSGQSMRWTNTNIPKIEIIWPGVKFRGVENTFCHYPCPYFDGYVWLILRGKQTKKYELQMKTSCSILLVLRQNVN